MGGDHNTGLRIAGFFAFIGAGFLIGAWYFHRAAQDLVAGGETATGTVVDFRVERGSRRQTGGRGDDPSNFHHYTVPIIRFTTASGASVLVSGPSQPYEEERLAKGDTVEVIYLPSQPETAEVRGTDHHEGVALVFTIFGTASMIPGVFMFVPYIRQRRRDALAARYRRKGRRGK